VLLYFTTPKFTAQALRKVGELGWHIDGDLKKTLQSFSESRPVVAAYALGVSRAAPDYTWAQLQNLGIAPDYNTRSRYSQRP
jgi:hypothetical protein